MWTTNLLIRGVFIVCLVFTSVIQLYFYLPGDSVHGYLYFDAPSVEQVNVSSSNLTALNDKILIAAIDATPATKHNVSSNVTTLNNKIKTSLTTYATPPVSKHDVSSIETTRRHNVMHNISFAEYLLDKDASSITRKRLNRLDSAIATAGLTNKALSYNINNISSEEVVHDEFAMKLKHFRYNNYYFLNQTERNKAGVKNRVLPWSLPQYDVNSSSMKSSSEFMKEFIDLKQSNGIELPWMKAKKTFTLTRKIHGKTESIRYDLPTPIIVLNLPKSGTTTLNEYFLCGGVESTHTFTEYTYDTLPRDRETRIGDCLRNNYFADSTSRPVAPLNKCARRRRLQQFGGGYANYLAYSDIGTTGPGLCYYSTIHNGGLEHIAKYYPNATLILLTRNTTDWYKSIAKWSKGRILSNWVDKCGFGSANSKKNETYWRDFYDAHTQKIRNFVLDHLSLNYIEIQLESNTNSSTSQSLEYYTGINSSCFLKCKPGGNDPCNKKQKK